MFRKTRFPFREVSRLVSFLFLTTGMLVSCQQGQSADSPSMQTSSSSPSSSQNSQGQVKEVAPSEFRQIVEQEKCVLVDVRTPEEYEQGHIPGARLINVLSPDFSQRIESLPKDQPICVYCRSGNRSRRAAYIMAEKGFSRVYNLRGGILGWQKAGYPVESGDEQ